MYQVSEALLVNSYLYSTPSQGHLCQCRPGFEPSHIMTVAIAALSRNVTRSTNLHANSVTSD